MTLRARVCFNCGTPMEGGSTLKCASCDISEVTETPEDYFNPVLHVKFMEGRDGKIFYIDHSAEHVPSPG